MKVKFKKLNPLATTPKYAKNGDAGMDLTCVYIENTDDYVQFDTGLAFEIPEGYVGLLFPRSSNSKKDLLMCNSVGVIDSSYRGPVMARFKGVTHTQQEKLLLDSYKIGDACCQLIIIPYPQIELDEVEELSSTDRGEGGFGSTGV